MPAQAPEDEFERILEQCRDKLSEIDLRLPDLDASGGAPPVRFQLEPPAPLPPPAAPARLAPPAPAAVPAPPLPVERQAPERVRPTPEPTPQPRAAMPMPPRRARVEPSDSTLLTPRRWAALAGAALVLACAGFWLSRRGEEDLSLTFDRADAMSDVPGSGGVAISAGNAVTLLDHDGHAVETRPLDVPAAAISWSAGSLWTANGRTPALVEHRADGGTSSFALNHVPAAIDAHEKYLWTTDADGRQIRQFLITRSLLGMFLQPLDLYDLPDLVVECFDMDNDGVLWIVDAPSRRLYRLRADGAVYKPADSAPLTPFIGGAGRVRGLAVDEGRLWLLVSPVDGKGASVLKRVSLRRLAWTPA